ncbi:MAG: vanadium-dependent haloperoxidase, partial [Steroidobacteraceae bacterium]
AWAVYSDAATTYLAGQTVHDFACALDGVDTDVDLQAAREEAISFAAYRIIRHRFTASPGANDTLAELDALMGELGYDAANASTDPAAGAAAVGNRIAECYIAYGLQDGANEANGYRNEFYDPVNPPIEPPKPGNPGIVDLDRWQPIALVQYVDQAGNVYNSNPPALSPEWGAVLPFSLADADRTTFFRDDFGYNVYHDPGAPPRAQGSDADIYKWAFALVAVWSGHLDQADGVTMDISPASNGNTAELPATFEEMPAFYDLVNGGNQRTGHAVNPVTGAPYEPQVVPRGDYVRVLAEFWADGPTSETPPGHWFTIFNTVTDHEQFERRLGGAGPVLGPLEWDVKGYFTMGGAMHDVAIAAWGIKGWYDCIRPLSAIRAMADRGQSSDPLVPSYHPDGIPLIPGHIEVVESGDPLAGAANEHVGKIKLFAWLGPTAIPDPLTTQAHAGWMLAENWWPYQRPTFVTPPFPGYVSGHSTFSRAAAEVMTLFTGNEFFPGGMSEFTIRANEFLVFEEGPSVDMTLQWATYRDAAEQSALSRIWGGIHPPIDDVPGRRIGMEIGVGAYNHALRYFD